MAHIPEIPRSSGTPRASGRRRAAPCSEPRARILLVDDHPPNLMALEAILEPLGEVLVRASSGAEAVELASESDFALVLLDLQMPELDGLETAALLKTTSLARSVPIMILTASEPTRAEIARGYASGAVDFLEKPLDPDVLRSKVAVFVDLYKQRAGVTPPPPRVRSSEEPSGRLSERLMAVAPPDGQAEIIEALVRVHAALSESLDLTRIAQRLVEEAVAITGARGGAFHHEEQGERRVAGAGEMCAELSELGPACPLLSSVFEGRGALRLTDGERDGLSVPVEVRSLLAVPVLSPGEAFLGALVLVHDAPSIFDDRDEELAILIARYAGAAVDNARLYEQANVARQRAERAELERAASEARLRLALRSAGLGTWEYNPRTGALRWDARARALAGLTVHASPEYPALLAMVHEDDRAALDEHVRRALDPDGDCALEREFRVRGKGGAERWLSIKGQGAVEGGRVVRFIGTILDVTSRKRVEQERVALLAREREARAEAESARGRAEDASRAKDEFLATVSHELRNPLNAILGWSRVLIGEAQDSADERLKKGLDVIFRNAKAQVQLVEDILEVSRIVSGKLRLQAGVVDVHAAVEAAVETVRSAAEAKGVLLESCLETDLGTIPGDGERVQQVLWNLLSNAVKFTPRGGVVRLTAQRSPDAVKLSVRDTGEGIDAAFLPFVFDRFRQADGSTTRAHGGLGLGLAIVHHLVSLHGGAVRAESEGRGKGATFTVELPTGAPREAEVAQRKRPSHATAPAPSSGARAPLAGVRVLVLDDEEDMRDVVALILEHAGASVVRARTVDDAIASLEDEHIDVALSDLAMPNEDGYAFLRRVRAAADPASQRLPLVAMTAYARPEDRHRVLAAGFQRHVAKPIEPAELVSALLELTRH